MKTPMKRLLSRIIAISTLAAASCGAMAQTTLPSEAQRDSANLHALNQYPIVAFHSTKTRAEVKAELVAAERAGTIANGDNYPILQQAESHKTRAQVQQELVQAEHDGTITNGDDYPVVKQVPSHKSRAEVRAELVTALQTSPNDALYRGH